MCSVHEEQNTTGRTGVKDTTMKQFNNLTEVWQDITGEFIEDLTPTNFNGLVQNLTLENLIIKNEDDYWKVVFVNHIEFKYSYSLHAKHIDTIFDICKLGFTKQLNSDYKYWSMYDYLAICEFNFDDSEISKFKNFETFFYGLLCDQMTQQLITQSDVLVKTFYRNYDFTIITNNLLNNINKTIFARIASVKTLYGISIPHSMKMAIKNFAKKQNLSFGQFIIFSYLIDERLLYSGRTWVINFNANYDTLQRLLTDEEMSEYLKHFKNVNYIDSSKMFDKIMSSSMLFEDHWSFDICDYRGNVNDSYIKGLSFITPDFLSNVILNNKYIENSQILFNYFSKIHETDNRWTNVMKLLTQTPNDLI